MLNAWNSEAGSGRTFYPENGPPTETDCKKYKCEDAPGGGKMCVESETGEFNGLKMCRKACENKYACELDVSLNDWRCVVDPLSGNKYPGMSYSDCVANLDLARDKKPSMCERKRLDCTVTPSGQLTCEFTSYGPYYSMDECLSHIDTPGKYNTDNCKFRYDCPDDGGSECVPNSRSMGDFPSRSVCNQHTGDCTRWRCVNRDGQAYCEQNTDSPSSETYASESECKERCCIMGGYPQALGACDYWFFSCEDKKTAEYCHGKGGYFYCGQTCANKTAGTAT